jgi:enoyl-CoA hydratase/carnithine racemase
VGELRVESVGEVATVIIDHPARGNSLTVEMWERLPGLFDELADDASVAVVVIRGTGGEFSAGADIRDLDDILFGRTAGDGGLVTIAEEAIARFPKPTVAAIEGHCIGGGWAIAGACDIRIASDTATFGVTPARIGVIYPMSAMRRLVVIAGPAVARYLLYSGDLVNAAAALRFGMVTRVVAAADFAREIDAFVTRLVTRSQLSIQATKELVDLIVDGDDRTLAQRHGAWIEEWKASDDAAIGRAGFLARRQPQFVWRGSGSASGFTQDGT